MAEADPPEEDVPFLPRLPRGRHRLPREIVEQSQRSRMMSAAATVAYEEGYEKATAHRICERAGVSTVTFYEYFRGRDACLLAAHEAVIGELRARMRAACEAGGEEADWGDGVVSALGAALELFGSDPVASHLIFVEALAGREIFAAHEAALESFEPELRKGRERGVNLPDSTEPTILGSLVEMIAARVSGRPAADAGDDDAGENDLSGLLPDLVRFALTPYLGAREADVRARSLA